MKIKTQLIVERECDDSGGYPRYYDCEGIGVVRVHIMSKLHADSPRTLLEQEAQRVYEDLVPYWENEILCKHGCFQISSDGLTYYLAKVSGFKTKEKLFAWVSKMITGFAVSNSTDCISEDVVNDEKQPIVKILARECDCGKWKSISTKASNFYINKAKTAEAAYRALSPLLDHVCGHSAGKSYDIIAVNRAGFTEQELLKQIADDYAWDDNVLDFVKRHTASA